MTESKTTRGVDRISAAFTNAKQQQTAALMPYFTLGYPDMETSLDVVEAIAKHSDLLELGVPFSDPIADGPTIQESTQMALENGTTVTGCISMVKTLRAKGIDTPAMFMGYYNPILAYGQEAFVRDAAKAGVDGFIVPDLPPEEADELAELADKYGVALIYFLAPTSDESRIKLVAERARGFIYLVSITGITGTKEAVGGDLESLIAKIREYTDAPLAIGFGINTPDRAAEIGQIADGVIVGSALIKTVGQATVNEKAREAGKFVESLQKGLLQSKK
ncbi:MAG: tryptophan synthase subunit alpha [Ardenticatenaceae bacterium]|nr:tryptophan synthase subunit alpha [Ardenticatenaceae bacterium]